VPWPVAYILVWVLGFGVLKYLASREVSAESGRTVMQVSALTGWLRGRGTKARLYRNAAIAWLVGGALLFAFVG
jgi:hypothetical protein